MSQAFFFAVSSKIGNFANQFLDTTLQCCPTILGRFSQLDAHFSCRFLEFGRGGGNFFEKKQNKSCCFQNVFNFSVVGFLPAAGIFCFPDPITGEISSHTSTDIACAECTLILAAADGTVTVDNVLDS